MMIEMVTGKQKTISKVNLTMYNLVRYF